MTKIFNFTKANKALLGAALVSLLAVGSATSSARSIAIPGGSLVNVNVSLNMQIPLADDTRQTLEGMQMHGRKVIYRLAVSECPVLLETIAATCRLANLNVSTQMNNQGHNGQLNLRLNGSAQFAITLKQPGAPAD